MMGVIMDIFEERFKKLNAQQRQAVGLIDGPVMVIAGPGSGKTELLSLRVANILRERKADVIPSNILCLTFTDAAAVNMRQRLVGLLGRDAYRVAIHTFHSFGVEIINRYPEHFYNGASFLPADDITQTEILEEIFNGLEHDNPLRSRHNDQFVYIAKAKKAVEYLKKAGLTPDEFKTILAENKKALEDINPIIQVLFAERVSKKLIPQTRKALDEIEKFGTTTLPGGFRPFAESLSQSLSEALDASEESDSTKPFSAWKEFWTEKNDEKLTCLSDLQNAPRMDALADIYALYMANMHKEGYYDYNDMILDAIAMLEQNIGVRLDLQERYQYILVDEFQDTNDAQMRILRLLTDHPVHEGRANIMVVGDDDQAIYRFQGAEISNIIDFGKTYTDPAFVVLKENYRSTQNILDAARHIIQKEDSPLKNILPNLKKELVAANANSKDSAIHSKEFPSREIEYYWIAHEAKKLITQGVPAGDIAVIAREHRDLEELAPYFHTAEVPVSYERQQNVLDEPHIRELVVMARFTDSIMRKDQDADELLPEILNYPFWGIDRRTIWELSLKARQERKPWLAVMTQFGGRLREIADFFIELGSKATYATAEEIVHELIGGPQQILPDEDSDDDGTVRHDMFSPFRSYYFGKDRFANQRADYLRFLSSLQSFVNALRQYRQGRPLSIRDMIQFFDRHVANNLTINNTSPFVNADDAVHFMSAHKAKGLEFEAVFVINCQESIWANNSKGRGTIPLPSNLPISPAGDAPDDYLRLFYVALTRAKNILYLTSYRSDAKGKESIRLGFLTPENEGAAALFKPEFVHGEALGKTPEELLTAQWHARYTKPFTPEEKALLKPELEKYQLSATHLNNFLDITQAGPLIFLEKNLLRFPEPKTASSAFGSAVHKTIQRIYTHFKSEEKLPSAEDIRSWFEDFLRYERINERDFALMLKRGKKALEVFYEAKKAGLSLTDKSEFDFKSQGVVVGEAHLTGKIDRIVVSGKEMIVCDYKTAKAIEKWLPGDSYEKIKAWKYRQQLVFYKMLIENSRDFGGSYAVHKGVIEFVEPSHGRIIDLQADITEEETERMEKLVNVVYKKIIALDFPDISGYSKDISGILEFEEDLLSGSVKSF